MRSLSLDAVSETATYNSVTLIQTALIDASMAEEGLKTTDDVTVHLVRAQQLNDDLLSRQADEHLKELSSILADAIADSKQLKDAEKGAQAHQNLRAKLRAAFKSVKVHSADSLEIILRGTDNRFFMMTSLLVGAMVITGWLSYELERRRKQHAQMARTKEEVDQGWTRFKTLAEEAPSPFMLIDEAGTINAISNSLVTSLYLLESPVGKTAADMLHAEDAASFWTALASLRAGAPTGSSQWRFVNEFGEERQYEFSMTNLLHDPVARGILLVGRDVTDTLRMQAQLQRQANEDALTGLPNRFRFMTEVSAALRESQDFLCALLFVDLDNFKVINDSLGHAAGDALLLTVADRLRASVRPGDVIGRIGGDEFVILLRKVTCSEDAQVVGERILKSLGKPVNLIGHEVIVSASIGIAFGEPGGDVDELLRDADVAMYEAKESGRCRAVEASAETKNRAKDRLELEIDLRHALEAGEQLSLVYQPIVSLETGHIVNVEALARWNHPTRGMISPATFVPIAEQSGLIVPLGAWVMREGCRQLAKWRNCSPDSDFCLSVNLSTQQLRSSDLVDMVSKAMLEHGIPSSSIKLEITESVMMNNLDENVAVLRRLRSLGVSLAVDDFGTGYSSMSYLSRLPIQDLKVDRTFVSRLGKTDEDDAIVRSIVSLAKSLDLRVTCEGVETREQLQALRDLECDFGQGYFFSRPLVPEDLEKMLAQQRRAA